MWTNEAEERLKNFSNITKEDIEELYDNTNLGVNTITNVLEKALELGIIQKFGNGFPLSYNDLVHGEYYTTYYEGQGLYTFKYGHNLWYNHGYETITSNDGDFTPRNGFEEFRKATKEEIKKFY